MAERRFTAKMTFMLGGLLIWAVHFLVIYIFNALACARRFADTDVLGFGIVPVTVMAATALALAGTAWLIVHALRWQGPIGGESHDDPTTRFLRYTTIVIAALSLVAIAWGGLPALVVPPCG